MLSDILDRFNEMFSPERGDLETLYRRSLTHDEPAWLSDRELIGNLDRTQERSPLRHLARLDDDTALGMLAEYMRQRATPFIIAGRQAELTPLLTADKDNCARLVAWAEQICERNFYSLYCGTVSMGTYLDWYSDLHGKSWFFEHVKGMRQKIQQDKLHETLRMGPPRATWDLNSLQHLVELGKAYWVQPDERYAQQYVMQALDWMEKNPTNMGINWVDEMAVARRAVSWVCALQLFIESPSLRPDFVAKAIKCALLHGAYLADYVRNSREEERYGYRLAAISALYVLAWTYPEFKPCSRWRDIALTQFGRVLETEFAADGAHHSGSLDMHRLCCEYAMLAHLAAAAHRYTLGEAERHITIRALQFLAQFQEPDGSHQLIGASWPERALTFGAPFQTDISGLLCVASLFFGRDELRRFSNVTPTVAWLCGREGVEQLYQTRAHSSARKHVPLPSGQESTHLYQDACLCVMREGLGEKDFTAFIRTIPRKDGGNCPSPGHDDWLHLSVVAGGTRILTDSGSLVADDKRNSYFHSPLAHNVLMIRNAEPVALPEGGGTEGNVYRLGGERQWIRAGARAWKKDGQMLWHRRDLIFDPLAQTLALCDVIEGEELSSGVSFEGEIDVDVSFCAPLELEVVQRGDLGCIFWKGVGLLRLHPYFPGPFRGFVERARESTAPAFMARSGTQVEPLQRIRFCGRLKLPAWCIFWMTWNVSGANTPSMDEAKELFRGQIFAPKTS
jgi:hypothetical protein